MKGYIVTLFNIPQSVEVSNRCLESAKRFNIDAIQFPAVYRDSALHELSAEGLNAAVFDQQYSNPASVLGNFVTQYRIWCTIIDSGEPGIVFEHDAVVVDEIPDLTEKGNIINLGKPSYGKYHTKPEPGVYPMFSKTGGYIPGAHGYYVTPRGAQELVHKAKQNGASPCDIFLNKKNFPRIKELYPWVIEAHDSFTTIQRKKGCIAKHNYSEQFTIL